MSDLEKYILENRDELDRMEPVPEEAMWQKVRTRTTQQKPSAKVGFNWKMLSIAALVLALAGWGLLFFKKKEPALVPLQAPPTKVEVPIADKEKTPAAKGEPAIAPAAPEVAQASPKRTPPVAKRPKTKPRPSDPKPQQPVVSEEERQLQQLVAQKQREIGLDTLDRAAYADLLRELDELEVTVEQARKDFAGMPQNERLVQTLIKYYELKIRILEQINYEINKQKYHEELEKRI